MRMSKACIRARPRCRSASLCESYPDRTPRPPLIVVICYCRVFVRKVIPRVRFAVAEGNKLGGGKKFAFGQKNHPRTPSGRQFSLVREGPTCVGLARSLLNKAAYRRAQLRSDFRDHAAQRLSASGGRVYTSTISSREKTSFVRHRIISVSAAFGDFRPQHDLRQCRL